MKEFETPVLRNDGSTLKERMTDNAYDSILPARYLKKNEDGEIIEKQEELFERVAGNVAVAEAIFEDGVDESEAPHVTAEEVFETFSVEATNEWSIWANEFEDAMEHLKFVPNTPTLINAGTEMQQLSACFVNSPEDDMRSIGDTETEAKLIFQSGGGCGFDFGKLRPYGDTVGSTGGIASGPLTFMRDYDASCETVAQGGVRRGAQMGTMQVTHPDIIHFIHAKNKDVSLAHSLRLDDPDDPTHNSFGDAIEEARELIDDEGRVPEHLRNAVEGHLSNFNISVTITDEFMDAVKNDERYTLINPRTNEPHIATEETKDMYSWFGLGDEVTVGEELTLPANEIWGRVVEGAWNNGEPGVMFIDRVNREHSYDTEEYPEYEMTTSNPSLRSGTKVLTNDGIFPIEELEDETFQVINQEGEWSDAECFLSGENETLYKIELNNGIEYYATEEHEWPVVNNHLSRSNGISEYEYSKKETSELNEGEYLPNASPPQQELPSTDDGKREEGFLVGWLYGDGSITERKDGRMQYGFTVSEEDRESGVLDKILDGLEDITGYRYNPTERQREGEPWYEIHASNEKLRTFMDEYGVGQKRFGLPDCVWNGVSEEFRRGFIDGLFSADGSVNLSSNNGHVSLTTSRKRIADDVTELLGFYGLRPSINSFTTNAFGGEYDGYRVQIGNGSSLKFKEIFNFSHTKKRSQLEEMGGAQFRDVRSSHVKIESVEKTELQEPVWDISVYDETHTFKLSTCITGNCAEQNLMEYEACNLGHINLSTIVNEDVTPWVEYESSIQNEAELGHSIDVFLGQAIDWDELNHRIEVGTRFLDNVVTMSDFPIEEISETVRKNRKIGLGIMGLAQLYIQLGVEYGSEEGNEIARQLMKHINHGSKRVSHNLSEERGVFENWYDSKYAEPYGYSGWMDNHVGEWESVVDDDAMAGFPIRNHNTTTIAPTGTTSMIGNTSAGCEPIFNVAYYKNVTDDIQGDEMLVEFDSLFLETLKVNDIDVDEVKREAEELMENNNFDGPQSLESVPDEIASLFVTAGDIDSEAHASVMCALQEGVDSSISKTLNAPNDATIEDAKNTFEYVYDHGGKSVTFYRDGSRTKQVQTTRKDNQETNEEKSEHEVPFHREAPDVLDNVERHRIRTGSGKLYVTIGEDEVGIVEVMATVGKSGGTMESFTEALARQISQSFQYGVPVQEVIDQLENIKGPDIGYDNNDIVHSVPDGIALALKRYTDTEMNHHTAIPTNHEEKVEERKESGVECLECGSMNVQTGEGCATCMDCGYSKCG